MTKPPEEPKKSDKSDDFAVPLRIYKDIADITWRMFVPSVGGAVLGVIGDRTFDTKPWLTVAGVTFGFCMVVLLVWQQLRNTKESKR